MAQISRFLIPKDIYERIFEVFLKTISSLDTRRKAGEFFDEFLTHTEKVMLAKRLAIAFLLSKKFSYRDISRVLRVSTSTIGRVSGTYKYGKKVRLVVNMIVDNEKMEEFWLKMGENIASVFAIGGAKASGWYSLKNELRDKRKKKQIL